MSWGCMRFACSFFLSVAACSVSVRAEATEIDFSATRFVTFARPLNAQTNSNVESQYLSFLTKIRRFPAITCSPLLAADESMKEEKVRLKDMLLIQRRFWS